MQRVDVAIGILVRDGHVLICQRRSRDAFGDLWEFPGGKCEPGETPAACLTRELREELAIEAVPGHAFRAIEHDYENLRVRLHPFLCETFAGDPQPAASRQLKWVAPRALRDFPFPAANAELIEQIIARLAQH
jgi:A/G-specific adenine glycosylase